MKYIALLRGINVGGHTIKMEKLRELFAQLGFKNVRSFIQTGNIFFESDENNKKILCGKIEKHLQEFLDYCVPVCLRTVTEVEQLVALNPFKHLSLTPQTRFAVSFFAEPIKEVLSTPLITPKGGYEVIAATKTECFTIWHLQNGRPGSDYNSLDKKLSVPTTTRFWHTLAKILIAAKLQK